MQIHCVTWGEIEWLLKTNAMASFPFASHRKMFIANNYGINKYGQVYVQYLWGCKQIIKKCH